MDIATLKTLSTRTLTFIAVALLLTACGPFGDDDNGTTTASPSSEASASATTTTTATTPTGETGSFPSIEGVVQEAKPAVVQITNEQTTLDQFNQPFTVPAGVGSGVIYDSEGHILTNNHVVEGAQQLLVSLPDGRSFPGTLVGQDAETDLAVVKIDGQNLPTAALGDSSTLNVGEWVVAIGNALALPGGPTVTAGVVGALGRTVQEPADSSGTPGPFLFDVIQTDAAINPGNSGGPLVNLNGEVVGINTLVAGQAEPGVAAQGIGFAISINAARPIADQLVATGHAVHPYLGVSYLPLSPLIAAQLGIEQTTGIYVGQVADGSPAAKAGLQPKDVITEVDGVDLTDESALAKILATHKPGDTLTLTVIRGNQTLSIPVTLEEQPSD
jgi:S1-C subfamily serine protease